MSNIKKKYKERYKVVIELFGEKTGDVVRTICFRNPNEFSKFLEDFESMRYPGYRWRYREKKKKKENNE